MRGIADLNLGVHDLPVMLETRRLPGAKGLGVEGQRGLGIVDDERWCGGVVLGGLELD